MAEGRRTEPRSRTRMIVCIGWFGSGSFTGGAWPGRLTSVRGSAGCTMITA